MNGRAAGSTQNLEVEVIIINSEKDILEAYDEAEKAKEKNQLNEILRVDDGGFLGRHA